MLPKLVVIKTARAFEATVNPRGPVISTFAFLAIRHGEQDAAETNQ